MIHGFLAVIDPNWSTEAGGGGRGAQEHYALSSADGIANAYLLSGHWPREVSLGCPSLVWMWTTGSAILAGDAHVLARRLSLRPCAEWVWAKVDPHGSIAAPERLARGLFAPPARMGLGQWSRKEHEHLWLCRAGDVKVPPPAERPRSMIYAPRADHSAKPEAAWGVIERVSRAVLPGVVGIEFNSRARRPGWSAFGALDGEDRPLRFEEATET